MPCFTTPCSVHHTGTLLRAGGGGVAPHFHSKASVQSRVISDLVAYTVFMIVLTIVYFNCRCSPTDDGHLPH